MVGEIGGSSHKKSNIVLKIFLFFSIAVVLALVVLILVFKINEASLNNTEEETGLVFNIDDPIDADSLLALSWKAGDFNSVEEGKALYEEVIRKNSNDINSILNLRIQYSEYLLDNGLNEESLAQLDLIDQSKLDVDQTIQLFMAYRDHYSFVDELEKSDEYEAKIHKLIEENNINIDDTEF